MGIRLAEIHPFRGLRYQPSLVDDLGKAISPPYDVISPEEQRALHARSPHRRRPAAMMPLDDTPDLADMKPHSHEC